MAEVQETQVEEEQPKTVDEIRDGLGSLSDDEVRELLDTDERKGVQSAAQKELERRASGEAPADDEPAADSFELVGEDGRRILRWHSQQACKELQARITATTGEETKVVASL